MCVPSEADDFVEDEYDGRAEHECVELGRLGDAGQPVHQVQQVQQDVQLQHQRAYPQPEYDPSYPWGKSWTKYLQRSQTLNGGFS